MTDGKLKDGPNIANIAALIGDRARADILTTLMSGQALTATELAQVADVTKQTISSHLPSWSMRNCLPPSRTAGIAISVSPIRMWLNCWRA